MFIERATSKKFLLAPAERNRGLRDLPSLEDIALRWSAGRVHNGFYKHLAPLEPEQYWVAAKAALCSLWWSITGKTHHEVTENTEGAQRSTSRHR